MKFIFAAIAAFVFFFSPPVQAEEICKGQSADDVWFSGTEKSGFKVKCAGVLWQCKPVPKDTLLTTENCQEVIGKSQTETRGGQATFAYPVGGVPAPELRDPPLRAYAYPPMKASEWNQCGYCATVPAKIEKKYVVYGPQGIVDVLNSYGQPNNVVGNIQKSDGRVSLVEASGIPITFDGQTTIWLVGTPGMVIKVTFQEVEESRPDYWIEKPARRHVRKIFGDQRGPQPLDSL